MKEQTVKIFDELFKRYPELLTCKDSVSKAFSLLLATYKNDGKVLVCGNGGSAADSEHIVGELMKGFNYKRELSPEQKALFSEIDNGGYIADHLQGALPAISLVSEKGLMTAFINDVEADLVFAQQVFGYLKKGDVLFALSTSGNSVNIVNAAKTAKALGGKVVSITGKDGGMLKAFSDASIVVPSDKTYIIQEYTLPVYHAICAALESEMFTL